MWYLIVLIPDLRHPLFFAGLTLSITFLSERERERERERGGGEARKIL